jgi:hypothetical protein
MLENSGWLPLINVSDESRFVREDDKRWVWYRRGEENESAIRPTQKFPPSIMIFAVIGRDYKSRLLFVEGMIDAEKYIENLLQLGFIEELDQRHGALGGSSNRMAHRVTHCRRRLTGSKQTVNRCRTCRRIHQI